MAPANAEDIRDMGSVPGLEKSPGGEHSNPLQYPCLENPMDRGTWWATVHGVTKSWTQQKRLAHTQTMGKGLGQTPLSWMHQEPPASEIPGVC